MMSLFQGEGLDGKQYASHQTAGNEETDWIELGEDDVSNDDEDGLTSFDASEGRCWCGEKDLEWCRITGHTFPLHDTSQSEFSPKPAGIYVRSSQNDGIWLLEGSAIEADPKSGDIGGVPGKTYGHSSRLHRPFNHGVDPNSKVMILSKLLK